MPKCPPTEGVRLQEVSVSEGSTVLYICLVNTVKATLRPVFESLLL